MQSLCYLCTGSTVHIAQETKAQITLEKAEETLHLGGEQGGPGFVRRFLPMYICRYPT